MSSGQPSSCRFPLTRHWISSSVSSLVGRGPRTSPAASWPPCSSVEPKLLGRVLLRGRVCGPSSLSAQCLASGGREHRKRRSQGPMEPFWTGWTGSHVTLTIMTCFILNVKEKSEKCGERSANDYFKFILLLVQK